MWLLYKVWKNEKFSLSQLYVVKKVNFSFTWRIFREINLHYIICWFHGIFVENPKDLILVIISQRCEWVVLLVLYCTLHWDTRQKSFSLKNYVKSPEITAHCFGTRIILTSLVITNIFLARNLLVAIDFELNDGFWAARILICHWFQVKTDKITTIYQFDWSCSKSFQVSRWKPTSSQSSEIDSTRLDSTDSEHYLRYIVTSLKRRF